MCKIRVEKSIAIGADTEGLVIILCSARKKNRSTCSKPSSQEKAYKVGCAMSVKRLGAAEDDKLENEKCEDISEDKKNTGKKPKDYSEVKDGKKI